MKKKEMKEYLDRFGWTRREFAERVGVAYETTFRWDPVPGPVAAYIRLYDRVRGCLE